MPFIPLLLSVDANTTNTSAKPPFVTKHFLPLRTYSSPSLTAVALSAPASEPAPGSVKQNDP